MRRSAEALLAVAKELDRGGARLLIRAPGLGEVRVGDGKPAARVIFRSEAALEPLRRRDALGLAEAFLAGDVDVEGDLCEVLRVTDQLDLAARPAERLRLALAAILRRPARYEARSVAFHYDRSPEFFLPWLGRWRCYSHGFYESQADGLDEAMARKLESAVDALGLQPGMQVLDMGAGWGCFVEYAGARGVRVHAITISRSQYRFVSELIERRGLPCTIELVNLREYRPRVRFDAAVFMGTFEHFPEYDRATQFLARHLAPGARVWADFCAQRTDWVIGSFMKKYLWPGPVRYVDLARLVASFARAGFNIHELRDDTTHYACSVRDWGDALEAERKSLAEAHGEATVRAFLLFLRGAQHFLASNQTQAYHLVAGRQPAA